MTFNYDVCVGMVVMIAMFADKSLQSTLLVNYEKE